MPPERKVKVKVCAPRPRPKNVQPQRPIETIEDLLTCKSYGDRVRAFMDRACSKTKKSTPFLTVFHCPEFSMKEIRNMSPSVRNKKPKGNEMDILDSKCILVPETNSVWYDKDGVKLMQYFPHLLMSQVRFLCPFTDYKRNPNRVKDLESVVTTLVAHHPPHPPGSQESRHASFKKWKAALSENTPCGVIRLTIHAQQGHPVPVWSPSVSAHLLGGTTGRAAASLMYRGSPVVEDLSEQLSIILAAMDPDMWQVYRQAYVAMSNLFPVRNIDPRPGIQCFIGHYLLINMPTTIHFDKGDPPDGWAAMVVLGRFTGNPNLCVPEIRVALPYNAGDVVFLRSWALKHYIRMFQGPRYVIVFSTSQQIFDWVKVVCSMPS